MYTKSIIAAFLSLVSTCSFSQVNSNFRKLKPEYSSWAKTRELTIHSGLTSFLGDLGGTRGKGEPFSKDLNGITFRPHLGLSYGIYPKGWLKVMATLDYTTITGADSVIKSKYRQSYGRYVRNLSFRSRVQELSVSGELYPIQLINRTHRETLLKPFVGTGLGVLHFNPKAQLNGQWIELKPLRLEGQGFAEYPNSKEYSLIQFYVPLTFGFKYRLDDQISLAFSTTFRKTFTDYLDDVSKVYIDPALFNTYLPKEYAALATQLYYRGDNPQLPKPGAPRAYSERADSYTSLYISFSYNFGRRNEEYISDRVIKVKPFRRTHKSLY